ncbi:fused MFS/spermidine synthase [bacterium]|nr:fused MFS/spermidine synthase [bacterium]
MIYLLFFLTGAAGLIYEMSWSRQIGIFFGHTVNAAAVVLAAYFGGMALGYALAARWSTRIRRPLAGYAFCELGVAAWALLTPLVLGLFKLAPVAALLNSENEALQTCARVIAALIVLLPATIALGATLPFVAQHLALEAPGDPRSQERAVRAYALNTAGAVAGVLLASFALIVWLGVAGSSYLAAGISAACGLSALILSRARVPGLHFPLPQADTAAPSQAAATKDAAGRGERGQGIWLALAALSGFGTLALQVLYVRLFSMTFNNSTYTFGGIVAVFLLSLSLGSWLAARRGRSLPPRQAIAWACLASAVLIPLSVLLFRALTGMRYFNYGEGFLQYIGAALLLIAAVIGLPVAVLALVLPLCWDAALQASGESLGSIVGRLTAANTLAATSGSLLASFALMPLLGLWMSFALIAALYGLCGALLLLLNREAAGPAWLRPAAALGLLALAGLLSAGLDPQLERSAPSKGQRYLMLADTAYGRIDVIEDLKQQNRRLRQNRHYTLGGTKGDTLERRQGRLPLLLHPAPRKVCFLGLATGITASSALLDQRVEQATAVELIPAVARAAALFSDHNANFVSSPRARVVVNDARYYLYATPERYDLIISDLFVPWHSQTGYLYTVEHYRAARERLAPGGYFCQWLPLYQLGPRELELIMNSFASVFPRCSLWLGQGENGGGTLALIGSEEQISLSRSELAARLRTLSLPQDGVEDTELDSLEDFQRAYLGDWQPGGFGLQLSLPKTERHAEIERGFISAVPAERQLNTDEHPLVEFLAPLAHGHDQMLSGARWFIYQEQRLASLPRENAQLLP